MLTFFQQVFSLLTSDAGSLTYHLVLAFSIVGALQGALMAWRTASGSLNPVGRRMVIGLGLMLVARIALFLAAGLAWQGLINSDTYLPVIDRAVTLFSLVLIIWLWAFPSDLRAGDAATALLGLLIIALAILAGTWWTESSAGQTFNGSIPDTIAESIGIGLCILGAILLLIRRPTGWTIGLILLALLVTGHIAALWMPYEKGDYSGVVRLAQMASYPLLLLLPQRFSPSEELKDRSETSPEKAENILNGPVSSEIDRLPDGTSLKTLQKNLALAGETSEAGAWQAAADTVARIMQADICLLSRPPEPDGFVPIVAGYDRLNGRGLPGGRLDPHRAITLASALRRGQARRIQPGAASPDLDTIAYLAGMENSVPVLTASALTPDGTPSLGLILLSYSTDRIWNRSDEVALAALAKPIAQYIQHVQAFGSQQKELAETRQAAENAQNLEKQGRSERQRLLEQINQLQRKAEQDRIQLVSLAAMVAGIESGEINLPQLKEENTQLKVEIDRLKKEAGQSLAGIREQTNPSNGEIEKLKSELDRLQLENGHLKSEIDQLKVESAQPQAEASQPNSEYDLSKESLSVDAARLAELQIAFNQLQSEHNHLKELAASQGSSQDELQIKVAQLQDEKQSLQKIADERAARLAELLSQHSEVQKSAAELQAEKQSLQESGVEQAARMAFFLSTQAEYQQTVAALQADKQSLQAAAAEQAVRLEALLNDQTELQKTIAALQAELQSFQDTAAAQTTRLAALTNEQSELQEQMDHLKSENGFLNSEVEAQRATLASRAGELRMTLEEVATLQSALSEAEASLDALKTQPMTTTLPAAETAASPGSLKPIRQEALESLVDELRQPLASITGYTDFLLGESVGLLGALQRKFLERVKLSTERMEHLVEDLNRVAIPGSPPSPRPKQTVNIPVVLKETIEQTRLLREEKKIQLFQEINQDLPELIADQDAIQQIFLHLLQYAANVTPPQGTIRLRARLEHSEGQPDYVLMQVTDGGEGIPTQDLPRVFAGLYRPETNGLAVSRASLPAVKALVDAMAGRIWVDSPPNQGATFSVLLPAADTESIPPNGRHSGEERR